VARPTIGSGRSIRRVSESIAVHARHGERGEGKVGMIVAVAVIAAAVFAGSQYIPVRVTAYEFKDYIDQETRTGSLRRDAEEVRQRILEKAEELELPLEKKHLEVKKTRSEMIVRAKYDKKIDFKVYEYTYTFEHSYRAPLF
jgi:hypothetical protein